MICSWNRDNYPSNKKYNEVFMIILNVSEGKSTFASRNNILSTL
jgi:hypothetical protein